MVWILDTKVPGESTVVNKMNKGSIRNISLLFCAALLSETSALSGSDLIERVVPVPADEQVPIVDFFRPSHFSNPSINPSGTHVAALVPVDSHREGMVIADLVKGKFKTLHGSKDMDISKLWWMSDDRILFSVIRENLYAAGLYVATRDAKSYVVEQYSACRVIGIPQSNPLRPVVWISQNAYDDLKDAGVVQINSAKSLRKNSVHPGTAGGSLDTGLAVYGVNASVSRGYPKPEGVAVGYVADRFGELAFALTSFEDGNRLFRLEGKSWEACPVDLDRYLVIGPGDRDGELLVLGPRQQGKPRALFRLDAVSGTLGEMVYQDPEYDLEAIGLVRHPTTRELMGLKIWGLGMKTVWFDPTMDKVQQMLAPNFRGEIVSIVDVDDRLNNFLIATYSDRRPPVYHRLDLEKKWLGLVKDSGPWIDPKRTRPMHALDYQTRDDKKLEGFLTLPEGASKENPVPLVVLPHGGPWVNDSWGWDPESQFLASRGYAVFKPNYRGSTGYDWLFDPADTVDFRKMHEDVTDGVHGLIGTGLIDPDRIAIMGGSFGGYLALCGATFEPDLYKCAVSMAGVFDWEQMVTDVRRNDETRARYRALLDLIGNPKEEAEKFEEISPLRHVKNIKIPVFVAHGGEDQVVSIGQSKRLISELKSNDVEHVVHFERREAHGTADLKNRIELYSAIETFLAENL